MQTICPPFKLYLLLSKEDEQFRINQQDEYEVKMYSYKSWIFMFRVVLYFQGNSLRWLPVLFCSIFLLLSNTQTGRAQEKAQNVYQFLSKKLNFSGKEFSEIKEGKVVVKLIDTRLQREVAVFGIVRLQMPRQYFANFYRDERDFIETADALQVGRFSNPAQEADVASLIIEPDDIRAINDCRVGNCQIKMSAKSIREFQQSIDWSSPDYFRQATQLFKQKMVNYVNAYLKGGNAALTEYDDQKYPLRLVDEFEDLLKESPYLFVYAPNFHSYLREFPRYKLPNEEDQFFWLKEDIGTKRRITSILHISVYRPHQDALFDLLVSSKQIYASHYFEAAFGLTALADDPEDGGTGFYLLYMNRSRIDALRHPRFGGLIRRKIRKGLNDLLKKKLLTVKNNIEGKYRTGFREK